MRTAVLLVMISAVGCVADFGGLLDPGCAEDTDCPSVDAPCIDARCDDGGCTLAVRACDDGNACTSDACDVDTDECVFEVRADGTECAANAVCEAGACNCVDGFDDCDGEPGCEAHLGSDPKHCHRCDFECPPGQACIDADCRACNPDDPDDCNDGRTCTANICAASGECNHPILDDACLISGQCRAAGELRLENRCQSCQPEVSQTAWSNVRDGTACDDANPCAVCQGGECKDLEGADTDCCRPPHCRDASGACRLPGALECVGNDGRCCLLGALPGSCVCL
jgi:hypothetical protein